MLTFLTSCTATTPKTETVRTVIKSNSVVIDTACKWVKFIYVNREDNVTAKTARQILAHNRAVKANCGASAKSAK